MGSTKKIFVFGGLVVAGYLVYRAMQKPGTPMAPPAGGILPAGGPQSTVMATTQQVAPSSVPGINAEDAAFAQWVATLSAQDQATLNAALPTMPQSDLDGITDILINHWLKGDTNITPTELAFWNYFYPKYHILGA